MAVNKRTVRLYTPYPHQRAVHEAITEHIGTVPRFTDAYQKVFVVKACRQVGKSALAENELVRFALTFNGSVNAYVAPSLDLSEKIYEEIIKMFGQSGLLARTHSVKRIIEFTNGSTIKFFSAEQRDRLRGYTVSGILVIDEAAFIPDIVYSEALSPWVDAKKAVTLIISTPKFKLGFFYEYFLLGSAGGSSRSGDSEAVTEKKASGSRALATGESGPACRASGPDERHGAGNGEGKDAVPDEIREKVSDPEDRWRYGMFAQAMGWDQPQRLKEPYRSEGESSSTASEGIVPDVDESAFNGWEISGGSKETKAEGAPDTFGDTDSANVASFDFMDYDLSYIRSEQVLEQKRLTVPRQVFRSEYLGLFLDAEGSVFGDFSHCLQKETPGYEHLYFGLDFGTGCGKDYTVLTAVNEHGRQVFLWRTNDLAPALQVEKIASILRQHGDKTKGVLAEENSIGKIYLDGIRRQLQSVAITPFTTDARSKRRLVERFQVAIQNGRVGMMRDAAQMNELSLYEASVNPKTNYVSYNAPAGMHDDSVMALMLAWECYSRKVHGNLRISFL